MTEASAADQESKRLAEQVAAQVREKGSIDPAYTAFEAGIAQFQQSGLPLEALIPSGERGLGFAAKNMKDGKSFWSVYGSLVRKKLCQKDSKLRKLAETGTQLSASTLVGVVMASLALPVAAIGIAAPIAGIIAGLGIDAFCEYTKPDRATRKRS